MSSFYGGPRGLRAWIKSFVGNVEDDNSSEHVSITTNIEENIENNSYNIVSTFKNIQPRINEIELQYGEDDSDTTKLPTVTQKAIDKDYRNLTYKAAIKNVAAGFGNNQIISVTGEGGVPSATITKTGNTPRAQNFKFDFKNVVPKIKISKGSHFAESGTPQLTESHEEGTTSWNYTLDYMRGPVAVVYGYYYNNNFYKDASHSQLITPSQENIYIDITKNSSGQPLNKFYIYYNGQYIATSGGGEVTLSFIGDVIGEGRSSDSIELSLEDNVIRDRHFDLNKDDLGTVYIGTLDPTAEENNLESPLLWIQGRDSYLPLMGIYMNLMKDYGTAELSNTTYSSTDKSISGSFIFDNNKHVVKI